MPFEALIATDARGRPVGRYTRQNFLDHADEYDEIGDHTRAAEIRSAVETWDVERLRQIRDEEGVAPNIVPGRHGEEIWTSWNVKRVKRSKSWAPRRCSGSTTS